MGVLSPHARAWVLPLIASIAVHAVALGAFVAAVRPTPPTVILPEGFTAAVEMTIAPPSLSANDEPTPAPEDHPDPPMVAEPPVPPPKVLPAPPAAAPITKVESAEQATKVDDATPPAELTPGASEPTFSDALIAINSLVTTGRAMSARVDRTAESLMAAAHSLLRSMSSASTEPPTTNAAPAPPASQGSLATGITSGPIAHSENRPPLYPADARRQRQSGTVRLRLTIEPDGRVSTAALAATSGFPLLDQAALSAVAHWRFQPATAAGQGVRCQVDVPIQFVLKE